jgi:molybdopterin-guanine dinucleotide biosynthesis protein A
VSETERLPVHGFVLAGGKSSRMGKDKALLQFRGRPMVEIAVDKLRSFCAAVSIVGEREDLSGYAPVVRGERVEAGPAAGIEAGLRASMQVWAMFLPVDVPLLPGELLRAWAAAVLAREPSGIRLSYLQARGRDHPALCLIHRDCVDSVEAALNGGIYKLSRIFDPMGDRAWPADAEQFALAIAAVAATAAQVERWLSNVNTPEELAETERCAAGGMKY